MRKLAGVIALALLLTLGCGKKNSGSSGGFTLSGILGAGLNGHSRVGLPRDLFEMARGAGPFFATGTATASAVLAIPLFNGSLNSWAMPAAISGAVDASGKMSLALDKTQNYVILLLDTTQTAKMDQVVGYLNLADATKGLMLIPTKNTNGDNMDVGTVTKDSGTTSASSSKTITDLSSQFSVNLTVLRELARTDDILQIAKNVYANYVSPTSYADAQPYFVFNGNQSTSVNAFSAAGGVPYSGYGLYFNLQKPGLTMGNLCGASAQSITLTPPSTITSATLPAAQGGGGGLPYTVVSNSGVGAVDASGSTSFCGSPSIGGDSAASIYVHASSASDAQIGFNWGGGSGFAGAIAAGNWVLALAGSEVARFDLKAATVQDADGHPTVYIPSVRLDVDGSGYVTKATVKLYTWDKQAGDFAVVTDSTMFQSVAKDISLSFTDYGQSPRVEFYNTMTAESDGSFTLTNFSGKVWKQGTYGSGTALHPATNSVAFGYTLYGASMRFDFR